MAAVQSLCDRVLLMDQGRVTDDGLPGAVVTNFLQHSFSALAERDWDDIDSAPGNEQVRLKSARVRPEFGCASDPITVRSPFVLEFEFWNLQEGARLNPSVSVNDEQGILAFSTVPYLETEWHGRPFPTGLFRSVVQIPGDLMNSGMYRVDLHFVRDEGIVLHAEGDLLVFDVRDSSELRGGWHGRWGGVVRPNLKWTTECLSIGELQNEQ
jgi:lipopolysaccharide transport system ATP-binding protein